MNASDVAARLNLSPKGTGKCPAHDDRVSSLSLKEGPDGKTLIHCFAGCEPDAVLAAVGLQMKDLFNGESAEARVVSAVYPYRAPDGTVLFEVVRYAPKSFSQRRPDGAGGVTWSLGNVERVPYNLPEIIATTPGSRIWVCEGEKDVANVMKATGEVATTMAGGAGRGEGFHHYASHFAGRHVVVLPDNDVPGEQYARSVVDALRGQAASVDVLRLPYQAGQKDVSDWLVEHDGEDLKELADMLDPEATAPVLLSMADIKDEPLEWLWEPWIPAGAISIVEGDPGLGKSMLAAGLAAAVSSGQPFRPDVPAVGPANVLIMSSEDSLSQTIRPRLLAAGANLNLVHALDGIRTSSGVSHPFLDLHAKQIAEAIHGMHAKLVVVDPLMAYLSGGVDAYRDQDMRRVLSPLARICRESGASLIVVRHLTKSQGTQSQYRGGGSIGVLGAARSCIAVSADGQDPTLRIIQTVKNNLSAKPKWLTYRIAERVGVGPFVKWGDV